MSTGTNSPSQPPTSGESVSLPSEKAPAPPQPQVTSHGEQLAQTPVVRAGQVRRSMSGPCSSSRTELPLRRTSSSAAKMPAGPAPAMRQS